MITLKRELICSECQKRVSYHIYKRPTAAWINDFEIDYDEYYAVCNECKEELFVPELDDWNEEIVENEFRRLKGLITISQIKNILRKYNIEKRPLSKLLGFGELTITRYLDGQLPSKRYSDVLFKILDNEQYMKEFAEKNKDAVSTITLNKVLQAIKKCESEKKVDTSAEKIALYIIHSGKEITNLLLQKVLYYVKAISSLFEETSIIPESCEAWKLGPVFPLVYEKYKDFGKGEISTQVSDQYVDSLLSEKEKQITDFVLNTFGIYSAWFLKDLTHCEEPWVIARIGIDENESSRNIMDDDLIYDYFNRMHRVYNLKTAEGIDAYIKAMKSKRE